METKKVKQKDIAAAADISRAYMSRIWNKKVTPPWSTCKRLAEATGTDPVDWADGKIGVIKKQMMGVAA